MPRYAGRLSIATALATAWLTISCSTGASAGLQFPAAPAAGIAEARPLMRFPDIHGDTIVFVHGEDIWSVPASGGVATRLTIHDGAERFPKFSPDGTLIAFTGEYDGNTDVFVMNTHGGNIRRVTWHPGSDEVIGWHPTADRILFQSARDSYNRFTRLYLASVDGTDIEPLILHEAAQGSFAHDGTKIAYNKVSRENRTWKRYQGGLAQDIYLYDFAANQDLRLTDFPGTDRIPMWIGDKIYFSSDRDRVLNLYSVDPQTKAIEQLTRHADYDVRRPSDGGNRIVYEVGGTLWVLDVTTKRTAQVDVQIRTDVPESRPFLQEVDDQITAAALSPSGERALVVARGEIFTVPKEHGPTRNLSRDSGSRDKDAAWSPDGKTIAYISDRTGEYEIYLADPKGLTEPVQLTEHADGYRHTLRWSPDSRKIAYADQTLRCFYIDLETKKITEIDKAEFEDVDVSLDAKPINDFAWSPDSRFIAYSKMNQDLLYQVHVYALDDGGRQRVSNGEFNDFNPAFTRDGKHLLFVSNRRFDPTFCDFEWEMVYKKVAGIYALTLHRDGPSILPFESDEEELEGEETDGDDEAEEDDDGDPSATVPEPVVIDFDGIEHRVEALPLERGNYRSLAVNKDAVFYLKADEGDFNRFEFRSVGPRDLMRFSFKDREEETVVEGVTDYALSADGAHILYRGEDPLAIVDATATDAEGEELDLSDLKIWIDPQKEWRQIFQEAWRFERDFYYDPDMHGIDWPAVGRKHARLLPYASCRQDVGYLIGEMIGELNTSHTYVFGGDVRREAESINVGLLGADFTRDAASSRYRFAKIYNVSGWTRGIEPPLAKPGVRVAPGDYLLSINGRDATADRNLYSYFQDLAGDQVVILVNDRPTRDGAREYTVKPLSSDRDLRYLDWVENNRRIVDHESNGQMGYVHLPDTYTGSAREFPRFFYGLTRKKGIIVDGRYNGGGLDPDIFLQRLDKKLLAYWTRRYSHDQTTPAVVTRAHKVCITNRQAGSGGDMLPMEFRMRGMGPIVGTRTWGGLVGVSMFIPFIDGGMLTAPDYRIYDPSGKWIVENQGVQPDIVVDLHPAEVARGYDAQLMKAIEVLKKKIEEDPLPWPEHEPFPVDR